MTGQPIAMQRHQFTGTNSPAPIQRPIIPDISIINPPLRLK
jgi:hypothetical protein